MQVISLLNGKGGTGKTTLSILIATCLARKGFKVCVVDTDPQMSVANWKTDSCPFDVLDASSEKEIYGLRRRGIEFYDYVLIDGAAAISSISAAAVMLSDLVLIPITASPLDFSASGAILDVLAARQALSPVHARFVITKRVHNARMTNLLREAIEKTRIGVLRHGTSHKQAYIRSMLDGGTVYDLKDKSASGEIDALASELLEILQ